MWRNSTVFFTWHSSQNTLLLCYLRWPHKRSGRLHKLRKKSSALQADCCYMKWFQICMWNLSSSLQLLWPLMTFKSSSYPGLWNQGKVLIKFNICVFKPSWRVYIVKKNKAFRNNRVKLKYDQTLIEIIANTAFEWQWTAYNSSTSSEGLSRIYFLWHSEEDKHLNTQEVWALGDKSDLCSDHMYFLDPAQKPAKRRFSFIQRMAKSEAFCPRRGYEERVHRCSKPHWLKW